MQRIKDVCTGAIIAGLIAGVAVGYSLYTEQLVTADRLAHAQDRAAMKVVTRISLHQAQAAYDGSLTEEGCFALSPAEFPFFAWIESYQFTAAELRQTQDRLLCQGVVVTADM